jgi:asparagine synthase (glutamine-hydrolysing)
MGFPVPFGRWVREGRTPLVEKILLDGRLEERDLFRAGWVRKLFEEHRAGVRDHEARLWMVLGLESWMRIYLDGEPRWDLAALATASSSAASSGEA